MKGTSDRNNHRDRARSRPFLVKIIGRDSPEERAKAIEQRAREKDREQAVSKRVAFWTMITGAGTVAAAVLAGVAAMIFWNQLSTMQSQLNTDEAHFRLDERPIIALVPFPPGDNPGNPGFNKDTGELWWNYALRNYGKGTAFHIRIFDYVSVSGGPLRGKSHGIGETQLVPTQDMWASAYYNDRITSDAMILAQSTNGGILVKIIVKYKDVYGTIYDQPLCLALNANRTTSNCDVSLVNKNMKTEDDTDERNYK